MQRITANEFATKQNPTAETSEPPKQQPQTVSKPLPMRQLTSLERATNWVDNITNSLYGQIKSGLQRISKLKPIVTQQIDPSQNKRSAILQKPVDMDEHLRLVKKFMRMNKSTMKTLKQRSMQITQLTNKQKEEQDKKDKDEQMKALELRRLQINERIQRKEEIMRKIRYESMESNRTLQMVKKKKFLYQQKQQAFRVHYLRPKEEEQRRLLKNKEEEFKPMDINKLLEHQRQYQKKRISDRINRSLTSRVLEIENHYEPPKFVPKSFLILSAEEEYKNQERKMKEQEHELNEYRKKEFLSAVQEKQRLEFQKIKQKLQQAKSSRDNSAQEDKRKRERSQYQRDREQIKNMGNSYMKELIEMNKKRKRKQSKLTEISPSSEQSNQTKRNTKSQYQIQLIKEERIESVQKIRFRKIDDIVNNERLEPHLKLQRLKYEQEKLGQMVSAYESLNGKAETDEVASLYLSSIHTKLAILQVFSPKNND